MKISNPDCFQCYCKDCSVMKNCSDEWLTIINEKKNYEFYKKGQQIITEGKPVKEIYFIHSGKAKIVSIGPYNKEQILWLAKPGDILGLTGIGGNSNHSSSAYALEDSVLCSLDLKIFLEIVKQNPDLIFDIVLFFADELRNAENRMKKLVQMNVREKIADTLIYLHNKFGADTNGTIEVHLLRQELAEIACTTKEQVSKFLSEFEKEGIISINHKSISILNFQMLQSMAGMQKVEV